MIEGGRLLRLRQGNYDKQSKEKLHLNRSSMYNQSTGEDNTDHLSKDFWKYKADNAEYTFFP